MELSDVLGIGALVVSVGSTVIACLAWTTSRRSADAAERQASAAEQQTELLRQQMETERRHSRNEASRDAVDKAAQARLVFVELSGMGGLAVHITNQSSSPVSQVQLDEVVAEENPGLKWRMNPRVIGQPAVQDILAPGKSAKFFVEFTDESGALVRFAGKSYTITYSFTDASGHQWRRIGNGEPVRAN
ncbi:MAG TPA: hypothetical protein VJ846_08630 [Sphingomicrobium sp.]|nr:hypothetical protein [Sphingomicrobium sp.]